MRQRGRKSPAEEMGVVKVIEGGFGNRPEPPPEITPRQAEIWREICASEPFDFFSTAALRGMLKDLCRYRESIENVSLIINSFDPQWLKNAEGLKRYVTLSRVREIETTAAARLATKLRLTNQSRFNPVTAGTASRNTLKSMKPWEL